MNQPPRAPEFPPAATPAPTTSLMARLLNVFATPGEVFEEIKASPTSSANWLVPTLLICLVGVMASFLIFSQPAIIQQIHESQAKAFDDQVKAGKMSQADADKAAEMAAQFSGPSVLKALGAVGAVFGSFLGVFWWGLILWLIGRFALKADLGFMKVMEVAGMASAISLLEALVNTLLVFGLSNPMASTSLAMLIQNPDPQNKLYMLLSLLNIMTFWVLIVRAMGLARLAGAPTSRATTWVFGVWALQSGLVIGFAALMQALFRH
jgi:hypothetical protein